MSYRIETDRLHLMMRQAIDSAASVAVSRFERDLREGDVGAASRVARLAAEMAIEQFAAHCNCELAMIRADHEIQARKAETEIRTTWLRHSAQSSSKGY